MRSHSGREALTSWPYDLAAFCLLLTVGTMQRSALYGDTKGGLIVSVLIEPVALLMALLLRALFAKLRLGRSNPREFSLTILMVVAASLVMAIWANIVTRTTGWVSLSWVGLQYWLLPIGYYTFVLTTWSVGHLWVSAVAAAREQEQRAAAAKADAVKAELQHLRQQLDPHFLFNALNGIAAEIPAQPKAAVAMVRELAEFLRYSLDHRDQTVSPFSAELDAVRSYLEVQRARFGPELRFQLAADETARGRQTPSFLLQPLVENAVKHALKAGVMPIDITVDAASEGPSLQISVSNTGTLHSDWKTAGDPGVGLSVLRRRLELHYPDRYAFDMGQTGDTVTAALTLRGEPCSA